MVSQFIQEVKLLQGLWTMNYNHSSKQGPDVAPGVYTLRPSSRRSNIVIVKACANLTSLVSILPCTTDAQQHQFTFPLVRRLEYDAVTDLTPGIWKVELHYSANIPIQKSSPTNTEIGLLLGPVFGDEVGLTFIQQYNILHMHTKIEEFKEKQRKDEAKVVGGIVLIHESHELEELIIIPMLITSEFLEKVFLLRNVLLKGDECTLTNVGNKREHTTPLPLEILKEQIFPTFFSSTSDQRNI
ncbi:hypothetical protein J6590_055387 [Homalodisca vitripennis]|nr:hypothetical protein J6590_055387 [Homalodisca vitripennis]